MNFVTTLLSSLYQNKIFTLFAVDIGIQWIMFVPAYLFQTEKFYDMTGSSTFLLLAYINYKWNKPAHLRQYIQTWAVTIWAIRLGLFLFTRILKDGHDRRFNQIKINPVRFFSAWTLQGIWVFVTLLPSLISALNRQPPIGWRDYLGWSLWLIGIFIEVTADYQKSVFRNNPDNSDKFIQSGLWSVSRHPNYFGEILLWFGLYISASSTFSSYQYLSVMCPVFNYLLITKLSGIPFLEKHGLKKWGHLPAYKLYVNRTPELVPFLGQ